MKNKLYVNVATDGFTVKDAKGTTLESLKCGKSDTLGAIIASLESCTKFSRGIIYIFTEDSRIVKWLTGQWRIRSRENIRKLIEIKLLSGLFKTVRYFHVKEVNKCSS